MSEQSGANEPQTEYKKCDTCGLQPISKFRKRIKDSKKGKKGELGDRCGSCMDDDAKRARESRKRKREEINADDQDAVQDAWKVDPGSPVKSWEDFIQEVDVGAETGCFRLASRVNCSEVAPVALELDERARTLAEHIGTASLWRWM